MVKELVENGILNFLSGKLEDEEKKYKGSIVFNKKTIVFSGTAIQLKNVSKFEKYGIRYTNKVSTILLIVSIILALVGLYLAPYGLILTLIFGITIYIGIKERLKPKIYGLTIQLNSGINHNFLSKDKNGINNLFDILTRSLENEETFSVSFTDNSVIINDSNIGAVGDGAISFENKFQQQK